MIRKKVNNFLFTTPGLSVDYLMKAIGCESRLWAVFNSQSGKKGFGASSKVYGAAYRFFEQKRILERLPKSRNRLIQEKRWGCNITEWAPNGGYDRKSQKILAEAKALVDKIVAVPMKYDAATIPIFEDCEVSARVSINSLFHVSIT